MRMLGLSLKFMAQMIRLWIIMLLRDCLIQSQKEQSEDLESIKQSISKMEAEISNAQSISIKLVDRINSSDSKREDFWREISDDISFVKGRLNGRSN